MKMKLTHVSILGVSLLSLSMLQAWKAQAESTTCPDQIKCAPKIVGKKLQDSSAENVIIGENTEASVVPATRAPLFAISVDGERIAGTAIPKDAQRKTDLALEAVDIQVKFDGLDVKPVLNVATFPLRQTYQSGETLNFLASSNYPAWISHSEIMIYAAGEEGRSKPIAVVPVGKLGATTWVMPEDAPTDLTYVLRVSDSQNRFDETKPLPLTHAEAALPAHKTNFDAVAPGYGDD